MTTYNLFPGTPQVGTANDSAPVSLGTEFYVTAPAWLTQLRFLQAATGNIDASARTAGLFTVAPDGTTGTLVAGPFSIPAPAPGTWGTAALPIAYQLAANTRYRAVVYHPGGNYAATGSYFNGADQITGPLVVPGAAHATANTQGSYVYGSALTFPVNSFNTASYYSDATITDTAPGRHYVVRATQDQPRWTGGQDKSRYTGRQDAPKWVGTQNG